MDDILGENNYSGTIVNFFSGGIANFSGSPSYKSVENILGIVSAVITRVERNPEILSAMQTSSKPIKTDSLTKPEFPERVTLAWIVRHVPVRFWISAIGLLVAAFILGIQASRISIVKEIFGLGAQ